MSSFWCLGQGQRSRAHEEVEAHQQRSHVLIVSGEGEMRYRKRKPERSFQLLPCSTCHLIEFQCLQHNTFFKKSLLNSMLVHYTFQLPFILSVMKQDCQSGPCIFILNQTSSVITTVFSNCSTSLAQPNSTESHLSFFFLKRKETVATNQHLQPSRVKFIAITVAQTGGVIVPQIARQGLTNPDEMFRKGQVVPPHHEIAAKTNTYLQT